MFLPTTRKRIPIWSECIWQSSCECNQSGYAFVYSKVRDSLTLKCVEKLVQVIPPHNWHGTVWGQTRLHGISAT